MGDYEGCLGNWGKAAALPPKHALTLTASMRFSIGIPAKRLTFYLQPQKVSKKGRSPNYVLHTIIFEILQGETGFFRSTDSSS